MTSRTILECVFRTERLRWPLDPALCYLLPGQKIISVERRAKYLLLRCDGGTIILHLGMSGSLRIVAAETTENKHDHVDLIFTDGQCLRLTDPRKFGAFLYTDADPYSYKLLHNLGPEPLQGSFNGDYLYSASRGKKQSVKQFIMDQKTVVGVGNIYASESLFSAGIRPDRAAGRVGLKRYRTLAVAIKKILQEAIVAGGQRFKILTRLTVNRVTLHSSSRFTAVAGVVVLSAVRRFSVRNWASVQLFTVAIARVDQG